MEHNLFPLEFQLITIDQLKVSLVDGDGNQILSNFKISIVLHII